MTNNQLKRKIEWALKSMTEDRDRPLYKWEEGYCAAMRETLRHLDEADGDTDPQRAKRHWTVAFNTYANLVAMASSPEEIEAAVQTSIYAADRFVEEYDAKKQGKKGGER